jgi:type I restriction enzyme R subunit
VAGVLLKGQKFSVSIEFVLAKYIETGVGELDQEKLPYLLLLKYHAIPDVVAILGSMDKILSTFIDFQKHMYWSKAV